MYEEGGDLKKAKFHYKVAAMAGHELARYNIGVTEGKSGNREQALSIGRLRRLLGENILQEWVG
jgi:TPR repeat protein